MMLKKSMPIQTGLKPVGLEEAGINPAFFIFYKTPSVCRRSFQEP
jgi:hypothetical protein